MDTAIHSSTTRRRPHLEAQVPPHLQRDALIRLPVVLAMLGIRKSAWWNGVAAGRYPKGIKIAANATAWRTGDILDLIAAAASA